MPATIKQQYPKTVAIFSLVLLGAALIYATVQGDFTADSGALLANPWGWALLVDVYVGFVIFGLWIFWRESHPTMAAIWLIAIFVLGNIVSCIYLLKTLYISKGNTEVFFHGGK